MTRIDTKTISEKTLTQGADFANVNEAGSANVREPSFADLHALYEIEYEKFIIDTRVEIKKRAQKLLELESIVFGNLSSE